MGTHMPYGITQHYLPPGRGDIPAFTPANLSCYSSFDSSTLVDGRLS